MNDERLQAVAVALANGIARMEDDDPDAERVTMTDLAAAALAAADQYSIDAALDAVHPWAKVYDVALLQAGDWVADIHWPRNMHDDHGNWHEAQGLGPTRTAAILAACKAAKEAQP